jgi:hypothetical protein
MLCRLNSGRRALFRGPPLGNTPRHEVLLKLTPCRLEAVRSLQTPVAKRNDGCYIRLRITPFDTQASHVESS